MHQATVHFHVISRTRLSTEICTDLSVDCYFAVSNQFVAMPAGTKPSRSEETVEAHNEVEKDRLNRSTFSTTQPQLHVRLGLGQADNFGAFLPLAPFFQ